ncbi:9367_t:CDS:2 [Entrophospora sp. SA101]|nr:9367_t:CDS:2 [Entrophospora sp. SA101]
MDFYSKKILITFFSDKFVKSQNEGAYVTKIIVPMVKASLKKLPIKSFAFVSTFFKLRSVDIPIQFTGKDTVYNFVDTLLPFRKILIVNLSLLLNADRDLHGGKEDSSIVSSPPPNN